MAMTKTRRHLSRIAVAAVILAAMAPLARATDWPQAHSDVPADPAIRFGVLPNGMRYAVMHNATPKGAVALRLEIGAGSLQESDAQQGLAHFLEHMAFRGSRNVPENEVWPGLQRLGMTIGADANAQTGWTQTDYQFTLPHNDDASVDTGLMRLREIASELTLVQRAMDDERGVILSEERLRDTPAFRAQKALLALAFPNSLATRRYPIGLVDNVKHAPVSLIRQFYDAYYRPDRAIVIAVGDFDAKAMEAKIAARFGTWRPVGAAGGDPALPPPGQRAAASDLFVDPGVSSGIRFVWVSPQLPDTKAREREDMAELVALQILGYRLNDIAGGPQHPFTDVRTGQTTLFHNASLTSVSLVTRPQDWRVALDAADTAVRRLDRFGVTDGELARARDEILAQFQTLAAQAETRPSAPLADLIADETDQDGVVSSPAFDLEFANAVFKDMTADTVNRALHAMMRDRGPAVLVTSPIPVEGGREAVAAALAALEKAPLTAETARASVVWPYNSFGVPGTVAERTEDKTFGASFIRFANGVRLNVKTTHFATGDVVVRVRVGNGRLGLSPRVDTPRWAVAHGYVEGGLKGIAYEDMNRVLAGKVFRVQAGITDDALVLSGETRIADLPTQLQVLAAYVSAPGWRAGAFEQARTRELNELDRQGSSPGGVARRDIAALLRGGDRRWMAPSPAELAAAKPQDLEDMLAPILASAPIEITLAGDISADDATRAVAMTFGALPHRAAATPPTHNRLTLHFPPPTRTAIVLHHRGRPDQAMAIVAWPTTDRYDRKAVAALRVLRGVVETRVTDQLRVRDGATYDPDAEENPSLTFPGFGYFLVAAQVPPDKIDLFASTVSGIEADLKTHPVSPDELDRAKKPTVESFLAYRQTNDYWAEILATAPTDPRMAELFRTVISDIEAVTAADIQHAAQAYLTDATAWRLDITPEPSPAR